MTSDEILARVARTLKQEVGPAVGDEFAKTQTFMAAVVLQKVSRQLALAAGHRAADTAGLNALIADLELSMTAGPAPPAVERALANLAGRRDESALSNFITALYATRGELGDARFGELLTRVRRTLRANIDRRMEYAE